MINGAQPGEIYVHNPEVGVLWRVYNFGANAELLFIDGMYFLNGAASTSTPGELYYYTEYINACPPPHPDTLMRISHTTDYFQHWDVYEHHLGRVEAVSKGRIASPQTCNLQVFPNPVNAAFNITYQLPTAQTVSFSLFNTLGQEVWKFVPGFQLPGSHGQNYDNSLLRSGQYILQLSTGSSRETRRITIIR